MKILLTISYDGTNYCGWQRQINGITIQQRLEEALSLSLGTQLDNPAVAASSRTDAGVHALGQKATFTIENKLLIPIDKLPNIINAKLPDDIVVTEAQSVHEDFNPRFHAKQKTYKYIIHNAKYKNPLLRNHAWFIPYKLDITLMHEAATQFIGTHDFSSFCSIGGNVKTTVRTIHSLTIDKSKSGLVPGDGDLLTITVTGDGFLYNMVRIIAGTLVYVGRGKIQSSMISKIIEERDRKKAGKTAPPHGLTLMEVRF